MRREIQFGVASLPRRPLLALVAWSIPEALPSAIFGLAIAHAVDSGFLVGRPIVGLAWLAGIIVAAGIGAAGSQKSFQLIGCLVEPFRDDLVRRVVGGSLRRGVAGHADDGAMARLTRQIEIVRDSFAGLIMVSRRLVVTVIGVMVGLLSVAPIVVLLIVPPFLLGLGAFLATLGLSADRQRAAVLADERLARTLSSVLAGTRDIAASGIEEPAAAMVAGPIADQAAAERSLARVATLRAVCFAVGGWLPLLIILFSGPWLIGQGVTTGAILGGLTYVLSGLQPALHNFMTGAGGSGLRFVVTLGRILDATTSSTVVRHIGVPSSVEARPA